MNAARQDAVRSGGITRPTVTLDSATIERTALPMQVRPGAMGIADPEANTESDATAAGVLRTFDGTPLPRRTEELVFSLRQIFGDREVLSIAAILALLNAQGGNLDVRGLARLLAPAGLTPLAVELEDGRTVKGLRRGWCAGYFEQMDARACSAEVLPAHPPCGKAAHTGREWRLTAGGPWQCGVCHAPAPGLEHRLGPMLSAEDATPLGINQPHLPDTPRMAHRKRHQGAQRQGD
jgi:hypothetical protein